MRNLKINDGDFHMILWSLQEAQRAQRRDAQDVESGEKPYLNAEAARTNIKDLKDLWTRLQMDS